MKQIVLLLLTTLVFFATANAQTKRKTKAKDGLFGRRSDVKDAHDRYGSQDTGYLQIKAPPEAVNPKKTLPKRAASPVKQ